MLHPFSTCVVSRVKFLRSGLVTVGTCPSTGGTGTYTSSQSRDGAPQGWSLCWGMNRPAVETPCLSPRPSSRAVRWCFLVRNGRSRRRGRGDESKVIAITHSSTTRLYNRVPWLRAEIVIPIVLDTVQTLFGNIRPYSSWLCLIVSYMRHDANSGKSLGGEPDIHV